MEENKKDVLPLEGEPLTAPQISEPVVNALAAALSKIETYVPTQYIDDGPPDIDADHLNHAEQAIMRVTNLANGAADAISALQSQVTQLNNNIGNTGKYLRTDNIDNAAETLWPKIEGSSSYDFTWIPENAGGITAGAKARVIGSYINSEYETQMVLSYLSSAPVVQRKKINGSWGEWKAFVIKSDLFTYEQKFENKDLNTIISPGCYGIGGKPSVSGATNYPEDTTGMLVVFCNTGVVAQHYYTYLGSMYLRSKLVNYNNWSSWEKITK